MPAGDRTGPTGAGPMTGKGSGYCSGSDKPGFLGKIFGQGRGFSWCGFGRGRGQGGGQGRGMGQGRGGGQGRGMGQGRGGGQGRGMDQGMGGNPIPPQAMPPENEARELRNQASLLEKDLARIKDRIAELERGRSD